MDRTRRSFARRALRETLRRLLPGRGPQRGEAAVGHRPAPPVRRPGGPTASLEDYRLGDPGLAHLSTEDLDPDLRRALSLPSPARDAALRALATPIAPDLFTVPLLTPAACARLLAEVDRIEAWCTVHRVVPERPNTMNRYGLILADFGLDPYVTELRTGALSPLAAVLFPDCGGGSLDDHHAFVVDYAIGGDLDLGFHVDDSEVTLNLCLAGGFDEGDLYFEGRRCMRHVDTPSRAEERVTVAHQPGVALLHAGKHRHGARAIRAGRRRNLIVWNRSRAWRAEEERLYQQGACPPWCGAREPKVGRSG